MVNEHPHLGEFALLILQLGLQLATRTREGLVVALQALVRRHEELAGRRLRRRVQLVARQRPRRRCLGCHARSVTRLVLDALHLALLRRPRGRCMCRAVLTALSIAFATMRARNGCDDGARAVRTHKLLQALLELGCLAQSGPDGKEMGIVAKPLPKVSVKPKEKAQGSHVAVDDRRDEREGRRRIGTHAGAGTAHCR